MTTWTRHEIHQGAAEFQAWLDNGAPIPKHGTRRPLRQWPASRTSIDPEDIDEPPLPQTQLSLLDQPTAA